MVIKNRKTFLSLIKESHGEREWTDINIQYQGGSLPCHKFVLGTASSVLQEILMKSSSESEGENLIFDSAFEYSELEQLLAYIYGVNSKLPQAFGFLFPSHLQVKPDIKHEPEENHQGAGGFVGLWNCDDWPNSKNQNQIDMTNESNKEKQYDDNYDDDDYYDNGKDYDYDSMEDFIDDDDEYDEDEEPRRNKKGPKPKYKIVSNNKGTKKYECPYCGEFAHKLPRHVFKNHKEHWGEFNKDRRVVNRKKNYPKQCPHCDKMLSCKSHYDRHLLSHNDKKERKQKVKKEVNEYGSYFCAKCGEEFSNKDKMRYHEKQHKSEYICEFKDCNEVMLSHLAYSDHMLFKHQKVIKRRKCTAKIKIGQDEEEKPPEEEKKHLCTECGRGFNKKDSLNKHIIFNHTERAIPSCICNVCGKKFKTNNKLKTHMMLHEPPTKPCPFCDKLFETDHKVKKHIKSNHVDDDQKLYQCSYCQKGFYCSKYIFHLYIINPIFIHLSLIPLVLFVHPYVSYEIMPVPP